MAQAHRHLGQLDQAAALYEKFLAEAPADDPAREQAERLLAAVRREAPRAPLPAAPVEKPPEPVEKPPEPVAPPPQVASPAAPAAVASAPAPPRQRSFLKRHWWIFPVAAVVVAGVAVGLALGLQPKGGCAGSSAPCLDWGAR